MSYRFDQKEGAIVVEGFENGIADSPFEGISDMRNVNIISVPGEASVNFSTAKISSAILTSVSVTSADATADTITFTSSPTLESGQAVVFSGGSLPAGITAGTYYWLVKLSNTTANVYSDVKLSALVNITSNGTGTFSTVNVNQPKYFTKDTLRNTNWMVDKIGQVWSDAYVTTSNFWVFMGNKLPSTQYTQGNGIGYYQASDGTGYIFVIHNSSIDYTKSANTLIAWTYQWKPDDGTSVGYNATPTQRLNSTLVSGQAGTAYSHETLVGQDNVFYFCDTNYLESFFEKRDGPPQMIIFDPTNTATYTYAKQALSLPAIDSAQCLAELGINLLIGGRNNAIYPWNRTATSFSYPILLAESNIQKMITVNTNSYMLVGNRGRIYITNGSQGQLYKKIPDHISGTVEPYYTWGGFCSNKNQLYFSALVTTNAAVAINQYGGLWGIDLDTKAIRLTNKLSYATYAGYASALVPITTGNPSGTGFYIGWDDGSSGYGIDGTISTPYTGSQAVVVSDLIPIGTYDKPADFTRVEYKLTRPLVSGESISIYVRLIFNTTDTGFGTAIINDSTVGNFSLSAPVNFKNAQWVQLEAVLNSTASSPSYTRLKEMRLKGFK